ncbi:hypothetical protein EON62_00840 [archaeon]|nr:MAG: hypothetical protein EON62_00840 [archaeon]
MQLCMHRVNKKQVKEMKAALEQSPIEKEADVPVYDVFKDCTCPVPRSELAARVAPRCVTTCCKLRAHAFPVDLQTWKSCCSTAL